MANYSFSGLTSPLGKPRYMDLQGDSVSVRFPIILGKNGGIGFQLEGGVITVDATSPKINVSFDRPMVYNGGHNHVPGGTPYDIGTPSLAVDARSLDIPITVPASVMALLSFSHTTSRQLVLTWDDGNRVLSTTGWSITTSTGAEVTIDSITMAAPPVMLINTTEHTSGAPYTLHIPSYSVVSNSGKTNAAGTQVYTGVGERPTAYSATPTNPNTLVVTFSEAMDISSASDPSKYSVPGLTIYSVQAATSSVFVLTTSTMMPSTRYSLTITGVVDKANNPI